MEKYGFLGGLVTSSLVMTTPPLNNGINTEIARRLREKNVYVPCRHSGEDVAGLNLHAIDPEIVKYELLNLLRESGVELILHTYIVGNILEKEMVKGVIMENKEGRQAISAKIVVDATGDADIAALAGAPFRLVKKPMTMMFNMVGVDVKKVLSQVGDWSGIPKVVKEGIQEGKIQFDLGLNPEYGSPGLYAEELVYGDELNVWSGNLLDMNGVDPEDLTKAEIITREHVMRLAVFLKKNVPGFEYSRIEYTSTQVGVRATRQIIGEASPTMEEVRGKIFKETLHPINHRAVQEQIPRR